MATIAGVDGCPGGWVAAVDRGGGACEILVVPRLEDLLDREPFRLVTVDIPIGLTETGPRPPDNLTRRFLGTVRGTSVMPAPIRPAAYAKSHVEATAIRRAAEGKGVAIQAYGIYAKVAEVDALMRSSDAARNVVVEVHPEVSFALWRGAPIVEKKKTKEGAAIRRALVEAEFGALPAHTYRRKDLAPDDLLDAFAALWTARRIVAGTARTFAGDPAHDDEGLPMRIVA